MVMTQTLEKTWKASGVCGVPCVTSQDGAAATARKKVTEIEAFTFETEKRATTAAAAKCKTKKRHKNRGVLLVRDDKTE